jgi:hypothetical protein
MPGIVKIAIRCNKDTRVKIVVSDFRLTLDSTECIQRHKLSRLHCNCISQANHLGMCKNNNIVFTNTGIIS